MIKGILLPEKVGGYYLFPKRILGFDIGKTHVNATQIQLRARHLTIEQCFEKKLEPGNTANYNERVANAINTILKKSKRYDQIVSSLTSTAVITKEKTLPFTDPSKIEKVIRFEIESLLPFDIDQAIVDFIITKQEKNSCTVLIAAVQKNVIDNHRALFKDTGIDPETITIDLLQLYGLYQQIPTYKHIKGGLAFIDLGFNATRIAYIYDGQLRRIRTLPTGISKLSKTMADQLKITPAQAFENILRFGVEKKEDPKYTELLKKDLTVFWSQVQFTLAAAAKQTETPKKIEALLLLGGGAHIKGLPEFATKLINIPCKIFDIQSLLKNPEVSIKHHARIPHENIISLATAFPNPSNQEFNLNKAAQHSTNEKQLNRQLLTTATLIILIIAGLLGNSFLNIRALNHEAQESEQELMELMQTKFKIDEEDMSTLQDALDKASEKVTQEEKRWFAFSQHTRSSFLGYLSTLSKKIDRKSIGLRLQKLSIEDNTFNLKGTVRDNEAIELLEDELRESKLFVGWPDIQKTEFDIQLTFKQDKGMSA